MICTGFYFDVLKYKNFGICSSKGYDLFGESYWYRQDNWEWMFWFRSTDIFRLRLFAEDF